MDLYFDRISEVGRKLRSGETSSAALETGHLPMTGYVASFRLVR